MKYSMKIILFAISMNLTQLSFGYIPAQVSAIKQAIASGDASIINCTSCDLRGTKSLAGLDLHGIYMPGVTFQPCVKSDKNKSTTMVCIEKQSADLTGINLANSDISKSCFDEAILDKANLTGANFTEGSAIGVSLKGAKLSGLIATDATFCHAIMPDGKKCDEKLKVWTGQGMKISCNCVSSSGSKK